MDRYFTEHWHEELRHQVRAFAEREIEPRIPDMEASRSVSRGLSRLIARQGWIGVTIPDRYGGMGMGHLAKTVIIEELARVSGAMGAMVQASQLGVAKIVHFGTERQKKQWLPAIAAGNCLPPIAVTEPESGGHVLRMTGSAIRDGEDYVLNGRKVFIGNSHVGDLHGVVVRTAPGSQGLSAFLVESDRPGFSLGPEQLTLGLHGFSFGELIFDHCRVPAANRPGAEGDGLSIAYSSTVLYGRAGLFTDRRIERYLRDAYHIFAPAGTSDIQRLRLGEMAMGKSKGEWSGARRGELGAHAGPAVIHRPGAGPPVHRRATARPVPPTAPPRPGRADPPRSGLRSDRPP